MPTGAFGEDMPGGLPIRSFHRSDWAFSPHPVARLRRRSGEPLDCGSAPGFGFGGVPHSLPPFVLFLFLNRLHFDARFGQGILLVPVERQVEGLGPQLFNDQSMVFVSLLTQAVDFDG